MQNPNGFMVNGDTVTGTSPLFSNVFSTSQWVAASFQSYFSSATSAGTIKLQFSNDPPLGVSPFTPTHWSDVPGSTATATVVAGATVNIYLPTNFVCRWLRTSFTPSAGTGTYSVTFNVLFP